ncbi:diacylglycerol/lipid kinase family protein [Virgibacillus sp. DJP39]|uniref:diacylglycerol/lipid kinase family protein n=1 Tax=Virgibacillus sp. DJP39 TaxID=3409790 RepID=UPI003BB71393
MYIFIVNPKAGNGRAARVFSRIKKSKLYQQISKTNFFSEYPGHTEEFVRTLPGKYPDISCIIIIGGDGTVHEVVNGLGNRRIPIAFIPGGSGNDFARGCGIRGKPLGILKKLVSKPESFPYWVGDYQINNVSRQFVNSIGFGFDAFITHTANRSSYKKLFSIIRLASLSYAIAIIQILFRFKPMEVDLTIHDKKRTIRDCWMVTVANQPYYGGGMKIIPDAAIQPDTVSILILHSISKIKVLLLFLTVFTGKHIHFKEVELMQVDEMKISTDSPVYYQVDGQTGVCSSCKISKRSDQLSVLG